MRRLGFSWLVTWAALIDPNTLLPVKAVETKEEAFDVKIGSLERKRYEIAEKEAEAMTVCRWGDWFSSLLFSLWLLMSEAEAEAESVVLNLNFASMKFLTIKNSYFD